MSSKKEPPINSLFSGSGFTKTSIDLADDLLNEKALIQPVPEPFTDEPIRFEDTDEGLDNARILMNEGLLEEAKRTLHRIVLLEPKNLQAKRLLRDIHDLELKEIFLDAPKRRSVFRSSLLKLDFSEELKQSEIIQKLSDDLDLNLLEEIKKNPIHVVSKDLSVDDHIDIGIGFYEIGLMDSAIRHFRIALSEAQNVYEPTCLLAQAYIQQGNGFDASLILEPLVSDNDLIIEDKVEIYYLLGRAYHLMSDTIRSSQWFGEVMRINSDYRDTSERLMQLKLP